MRKLKSIHPEIPSQADIANTTTNHLSRELQAPHRRECRVCTDDSQDKDNPLGSYCECDGSMKWVHRNCLREWLRRRLRTREIKEEDKEWRCQLCKTRIRVERQYSKECRSRQSLEENVREHCCTFVVSLIGIIVAGGMLLFGLSVLFIQIGSGYNNESWVDRAIIIFTVIIGGVLLFFFGYHMHSITVHRVLHIVLVDE